MLWLLAILGFGVMTLAHTAPFPFLLEYIGPGRSVWSMPKSAGNPTVYLTFDDGPNPEATPALLDVLAKEDARATFFVIPRHVNEETAPILRRMFDEGHAVALHWHSRTLMLKKPEDLAVTLETAADEIERLAGSRPCPLFRPHAGWRGGQMYAGLQKANHTLVGWSFGMWDWSWWRAQKPEKIASRLAGRASDGSVVVMHDGDHKDPRADRSRIVAAAAELVPALRARGFAFGLLCEP
jgi:peptidoglycan/xylan/chitin deacetylase (PgdA/CDA1 family)